MEWIFIVLNYILYGRSNDDNNFYTGVRISIVMAALQGTLSPMIFFYINPSVRAKWYHLFGQQFRKIRNLICRKSDNDSNNNSNSSISNGNIYDSYGDGSVCITAPTGSEMVSRTDSMYVLEESFSVIIMQEQRSSTTELPTLSSFHAERALSSSSVISNRVPIFAGTDRSRSLSTNNSNYNMNNSRIHSVSSLYGSNRVLSTNSSANSNRFASNSMSPSTDNWQPYLRNNRPIIIVIIIILIVLIIRSTNHFFFFFQRKKLIALIIL